MANIAQCLLSDQEHITMADLEGIQSVRHPLQAIKYPMRMK